MNKLRLIPGYFLSLIFLFISAASYAQKTAVNLDPEQSYKLGLELFDKEKYAAAQNEFNKTLHDPKVNSVEARANAAYFASICGLELFNKDADILVQNFIDRYPESPKVQTAYFRLGKYLFAQKRYKESVTAFEKSGVYNLSNSEAGEYYFKTGYGYFHINNFDKASKAFFEVKNTESKYAQPASFYYAHIEYQNKNYETALKDFLKLQKVEAYAPVVPFYIAQIYYFQGKYDSLISYATPMIEKANPQNALEISHLLGDAWFKKSDYNKAVPYLETFKKTAPNFKKDDFYQLGYALYKIKEYNRAIENLEKVTDGADSLAQNAVYIMADCYLKTDMKANSRNAFLVASKSDFDKQIKEDALYNYGKISCELGFQTESINAFQKYMQQYPSSDKLDDINSLLAEMYLTTKNYKDALEALDNIKNKTDKVKKAYQRVAYFRAVELFNNSDYQNAVSYFEKVEKYPYDEKLIAQAKYWNAEILFKKGDYDGALKGYQEFLYMPQAVELPNYNTVNYDLGYCYFKKEDYPTALSWFRKYTKERKETDEKRFDDAYIRIADSYFILREYGGAVEHYDAAIKEKSPNSDYALFQKGIIQGIEDKTNDKINTMQQVIDNYPNSLYVDDAIFEEANAYQSTGEDLQALNLFNDLATNYPKSGYVKKSLLGLALIYYNQKRDEKALDAYKELIQQYPASPEAKEALLGIKNIYVNAGDAQGYLKYASQFSFANVTEASQDSVTYEAAEQRYMKGDCETSAKDFEDYLAKFKNGSFVLNASFYKAECDYKAKNYESALTGYNYVISKPKNNFTEKSLLKAANINYTLKQYDKALELYSSLEKVAEFKANILDARIGQMRCASQLGKNDIAASSAKKVTEEEKASSELSIEAHLTFGKALLAQDSTEKAIKEFESVAKIENSEAGSEAEYNLALIQFKQAKYDEAEKTIFTLVNKYSSDYWTAKGYILLADNYMQKKDAFQAKATLKSIVDNYEGEDLKLEAKKKLDDILAKEAAQQAEEEKQKEKKAEGEEPVLNIDTKNNIPNQQ